MELQAAINLFPTLNTGGHNPLTLSRILWVFYASNQKYFTLKELKSKTNLNDSEIISALEVLNSLGDVASKNQLVDDLFFIDINGSIKNLKNGVIKSKNALMLLETIADARDNSNPSLNIFIKKIIMFYSEVIDTMDLKVKEYFNY